MGENARHPKNYLIMNFVTRHVLPSHYHVPYQVRAEAVNDHTVFRHLPDDDVCALSRREASERMATPK